LLEVGVCLPQGRWNFCCNTTDDTSHSAMLTPVLKIRYVTHGDYKENAFVKWLYLLNRMFDSCTLFLRVTITKSTSCKIEQLQVFHFLFPHGLTSMFLVGVLSISTRRPYSIWIAKEQGSPELVSDYGEQRAHF
jgi:hypothetical protein